MKFSDLAMISKALSHAASAFEGADYTIPAVKRAVDRIEKARKIVSIAITKAEESKSRFRNEVELSRLRDLDRRKKKKKQP